MKEVTITINGTRFDEEKNNEHFDVSAELTRRFGPEGSPRRTRVIKKAIKELKNRK